MNKYKLSTLKILSTNNLLSMSSILNNAPYINTAFYSYDNSLNLYYLSSKDAQHIKNIINNANVAVTIFDSHSTMKDKLAGLQIFGVSKKARGKTLLNGFLSYTKRFAKETKGIIKPQDFTKLWGSELYVIVPEKIKVLDEEKFGEEIYNTVLIENLSKDN